MCFQCCQLPEMEGFFSGKIITINFPSHSSFFFSRVVLHSLFNVQSKQMLKFICWNETFTQWRFLISFCAIHLDYLCTNWIEMVKMWSQAKPSHITLTAWQTKCVVCHSSDAFLISLSQCKSTIVLWAKKLQIKQRNQTKKRMRKRETGINSFDET